MNWHKLAWMALAVAFVVLQIALIAAKLTGAIAASWWWVLTPLWLPIVCAVAIAVLGVALFASATSNGGNPFQ